MWLTWVGQGLCTHSHAGTQVDVVSIVSLLHHLAPLETVTTATICFGLECHMSLPLNSLLVRTNHMTLQRVGMYNLPEGLDGEQNQM